MDGYVVKRYPAWKRASSAGDRIPKHFVAVLVRAPYGWDTERMPCTSKSQSDTVPCSRRRDAVSAVDNLMLDAKQAILDEQHRRFRALQQEGLWSEAMTQFHVTLGCASDLLNKSLQLLQRVLDKRRPPEPPAPVSPAG